MTTTKPASCQMKTHDILAMIFLSLLCVFGILSFFVTPRYPDGVKDILLAVIDGLGMVLSFKFGVHVATQPGLANMLGVSTSAPLDASLTVNAQPDLTKHPEQPNSEGA